MTVMTSRIRALSPKVFLFIVSLSVLTQSGRAQVVNLPMGIPMTKGSHLNGPSHDPIPTPRSSSFQASGLNFAPSVTYASGGQDAYFASIADVNGDGKPDIVVANGCGSNGNCNPGSVAVLLGNGDGTFQPAVIYGSGGSYAYSIAIADVNKDGHPDLLVANECSGSCSNNGTVGVLLGNGDGTFQPAVTYNSGAWSTVSIAVGD